MLKISDLNLATLNNVQYTLAPFTPGKEWLVLVKGQQVGIIRANGDRFGWCDRDGGHWFSEQDTAARVCALVARVRGWGSGETQKQ